MHPTAKATLLFVPLIPSPPSLRPSPALFQRQYFSFKDRKQTPFLPNYSLHAMAEPHLPFPAHITVNRLDLFLSKKNKKKSKVSHPARWPSQPENARLKQVAQ
ncbi:hypothetical protein [Maribellus maritimus]|uniref:hypothetical protein n=1 Tax=Maribellus maritimus TaxID=2870838 RepID=UPI001EEAB294|nr:hypothetical protein [Maribellus maritimus]MCG6190845.1 hypothetical protein [Maribellus maritimus]